VCVDSQATLAVEEVCRGRKEEEIARLSEK